MTFQIDDLAIIMGTNPYWDGCIVKITSHLLPPTPLLGYGGLPGRDSYQIEIVAFSPAMMDPARNRPAYQKIGADVGPWTASHLEPAKNFSALCTVCQGSSFCEVMDITETRTVFECKSPLGHKVMGGHSTPYFSLDHDQRTIDEAKWLTPTSKWAWLSLAPLLTAQPTIEYPKSTPEPACSCDIFNFGCTCKRLDWENKNA